MGIKAPTTKHTASWPLKQTHGINAELRALLGLHRGSGSYVTFHRVDGDGKFRNLFSIHAAELETHYLAHRNALRKDAYFSINGFWHYELKDTPPPFITGVLTRKTKHVRYLNACYSDIDCYNKGLTPKAALVEIGRLIQDGTLPPPSFGLLSRGLWLFWLLQDVDDSHRPPRQVNRNLAGYQEIQKRISRLLAAVGADTMARDAARTTRVPGSMNSKNNTRVDVLWPAGGRAPITYTLPQLMAFFRVELPATIPAHRWKLIRRAWDYLRRRKETGKTNPWDPVNDQRLKQFVSLGEIRGGFNEGTRNRAALIYARLLTTRGVMAEDVQTALEDFGRNCTPPLTPSEIDSAVKSGTQSRTKSIGNPTISDWLEIDWKEHAALKKEFGRYAWKPTYSPPPSTAKKRRAEIKRLVEKHGLLPNRKMAVLLQKRGYQVSPTQVVKDYRDLGIGPATGARLRGSASRG